MADATNRAPAITRIHEEEEDDDDDNNNDDDETIFWYVRSWVVLYFLKPKVNDQKERGEGEREVGTL